MKWASLLTFCLQNSLNPIVFRYATTEAAASDRASTSAILFCTEALKCVASFGLLVIEEGGSASQALTIVSQDGVQKWRQAAQLAVPAVIYALQNALLQWSAGNLSAAVWQVTYQGKILVTAAFSVFLLQKQIKRAQWLAIAILGLGIAMVQLSGSRETKQESMANAAEQSIVKGLGMLILACFCSGFASVWTEMVFKQVGAAATQEKISVWLQNMQLALFTMLLTIFSFVLELLFPANVTATASQHSFFKGFTVKTWALTVNNAVGGLLVALVIKYADNILRGFASAFATINCSLIAVVTFGFVLRLSFGAGTLMVVGSTLVYGGVLKLPGEWWNSECDACAASARTYDPVPTAEQATEAPDANNSVRAASGVELTRSIGKTDAEQASFSEPAALTNIDEGA